MISQNGLLPLDSRNGQDSVDAIRHPPSRYFLTFVPVSQRGLPALAPAAYAPAGDF